MSSKGYRIPPPPTVITWDRVLPGQKCQECGLPARHEYRGGHYCAECAQTVGARGFVVDIEEVHNTDCRCLAIETAAEIVREIWPLPGQGGRLGDWARSEDPVEHATDARGRALDVAGYCTAVRAAGGELGLGDVPGWVTSAARAAEAVRRATSRASGAECLLAVERMLED